MKNSHSKLVSSLLAFALALGSLSVTTAASAAESWNFDTKPTTGYIILDLFVMRPLTLVGTVAGATTFVVSLPFTALGDNIEETAETLVVEPFQYTFLRPLGHI